jgi:hypothetical protein
MKFGALPTREEEMFHDPIATGRLSDLTNWLPATRVEQGVLRTVSFGGPTFSRATAVIGG